jgi:hypothetical protein
MSEHSDKVLATCESNGAPCPLRRPACPICVTITAVALCRQRQPQFDSLEGHNRPELPPLALFQAH